MEVWSFITGAVIVLLILVTICFLLYCGYIHYIHIKYDHIPGPPRDSFLFGHAPTLIEKVTRDIIVYDIILEWVKEYGPVIRINALHIVKVIVISTEGVKECLLSTKYSKDDFYDRLETMFGVRCLGKGLLSDRDNDHWHKQRRIMDPAFSKTYLMGSMNTFNEKTEEMMSRLEEKADGKTHVGFQDMMCRITLDIIGKAGFGMEVDSLHDDQTPFPQAINMVMNGFFEIRNPYAEYMPGKRSCIRNIREGIKFLRKTGRECIEQRMKAIKDGEDIPMDVLTQILKGAEIGDSWTMEDLIDNFVTFFVAGQETTANQLSFAVLELARNPEILTRVQAEVDEVIGSKRDIEYEDLGKLQYLSQILKETLRLYPTAPGTSRLLEKEVVIEGVRIPPRTSLMLLSYVMGRMEKFYKDPLVFDPDRFHPNAPKPGYAYFPFSLGPRSCIGQVLSQIEAKIVLAKLLQRFEFKLVEGQSFKILDTGTLRPIDGVICTLRPRAELKTK